MLEKRREFLYLVAQSTVFGVAVAACLGFRRDETAQAVQQALQASGCGVGIAGLMIHLLT